MSRILVVDDDTGILSMLRRALHYEGYGVDVAATGEEALAQALSGRHDLIILDLMLPGVDGMEICHRLRANPSMDNIPILMLTARDEVEDRVRGLDTGADDYLVKPFSLAELQARVRALLRRRPSLHESDADSSNSTGERLSFADLIVDLATREVWRKGRPLTLTVKEFDLLALFLRNPRRVLRREEIMEKIWGYDFSGESNVLEVYIGYLRNKLEAGGEKRLIQTIRGVGYALR